MQVKLLLLQYIFFFCLLCFSAAASLLARCQTRLSAAQNSRQATSFVNSTTKPNQQPLSLASLASTNRTQIDSRLLIPLAPLVTMDALHELQTPRTIRTDRIPIKVAVRCRPMNSKEASLGATSVIGADNPSHEVRLIQNIAGKPISKVYSFDHVFDHRASQADVYDQAVQPIVEEVLEGYNCTIFAYGQTSTGKTFTMEGERDLSISTPAESSAQSVVSEKSGVIFRAVNQIFSYLESDPSFEYTVRLSSLELYNEDLLDLLCVDDTKRLRILEDPRKGATVSNAEEVAVTSARDILNVIESASKRRQVAETQLNRNSSRSHVIHTITIHIKEATHDGEDLVKTGKLNLVDLAGSENIGRSGAVDKRAKEAGIINQSLLTLGRVITALVEHSPHIPYRESKLTRLLQESLGGRAKTCIIATISPASINMEETLSTLDYANRAKNIKNRPEINQKMTKRALIREMSTEIESLKAELAANREKNGVYLPHEKFAAMEGKISYSTMRIAEIEQQLQDREKEFVDLQRLFGEKESALDEEVTSHLQTKTDLQETTDTLHRTKSTLRTTMVDLAERKAVLQEHASTEDRLYAEADSLLSKLKAALGDTDGLFSKIARKSAVESSNRQRVSDFSSRVIDDGIRLSEDLQTLGRSHEGKVEALLLQLQNNTAEVGRSSRLVADKLSELNVAVSACLGQMSTAVSSFGEDAQQRSTMRTSAEEEFVQEVQQQMSRFAELFAGAIGTFQSFVAGQTSAMAASQQSAASELMALKSAVQGFVSRQKEGIEDLVSTVEQETSVAVAQIAMQQAELRRVQIDQREKTVQANQQFMAAMHQLMNEHMKSMCETLGQSVDDATGGLAKASEAIERATLSATSKAAVLQAGTSEFEVAITEQFVATEDGLVRRGQEMVSALGCQTQSAVAAMESELAVSSQESSQLCSSFSRSSEDAAHSFGQFVDERVAFVVEAGRSAAKSLSSLSDDAVEVLERMDSDGATFQAAMDLETGAVASFVADAVGSLVAGVETIKQTTCAFVDGYVMDAATGSTPVKKDVPVPDALPKTRAEEDILAEFRLRNAQLNVGSPMAGSRTPLARTHSNVVAAVAAVLSPMGGSNNGTPQKPAHFPSSSFADAAGDKENALLS